MSEAPSAAAAAPQVAPPSAGGPALHTRRMTLEDLDAVMAIETDVYPFPWTRGNFADSIASGYDAWLFEDGQALAGYAVVMWLPDEVHLLNISIARARQGCGLGRAALRALCADAARRGARSMLLEVRPSNAPARALYASEGFAAVGVRKRYYPAAGGEREDALVLIREISGG